MKFLKLKTIVFSLMAVVMISVFLSSCEQNQITPTNEIEESTISSSKTMDLFLPDEIINLEKEEIEHYIENLTKEEYEILYNDNIIYEFILNTDNFNAIFSMYLENGSFKDVNLNEYFSASEVQNVESKFLKIEELSSRDCWVVEKYCCGYTGGGCVGIWPFRHCTPRTCIDWHYVYRCNGHW